MGLLSSAAISSSGSSSTYGKCTPGTEDEYKYVVAVDIRHAPKIFIKVVRNPMSVSWYCVVNSYRYSNICYP
jgi:hypothetical protein